MWHICLTEFEVFVCSYGDFNNSSDIKIISGLWRYCSIFFQNMENRSMLNAL